MKNSENNEIKIDLHSSADFASLVVSEYGSFLASRQMK